MYLEKRSAKNYSEIEDPNGKQDPDIFYLNLFTRNSDIEQCSLNTM